MSDIGRHSTWPEERLNVGLGFVGSVPAHKDVVVLRLVEEEGGGEEKRRLVVDSLQAVGNPQRQNNDDQREDVLYDKCYQLAPSVAEALHQEGLIL